MNTMLGLVWCLIAAASSLDMRDFSFVQSSIAAMNTSSDISLEYAVSCPGSALIDCVQTCAQFPSCAGIELCNTTPKLCRLWSVEFEEYWSNPDVPQCKRFPKTLRTIHGCADCECVSSYESWPGVKTLTVNGQHLSVPCYSSIHWWTVIQRRLDGTVPFYRDWTTYKNGFGSLLSEFWLGNENIHQLTSSGLTFLRIDLMDNAGEWRYAEYSTFTVESEVNKYRLTISGYSGNAGDSMTYHSGMMFSTYDSDNDLWSDNCALNRLGGWWYKSCHEANLNGEYANIEYSDGINWNAWHGFYYSMKEVRMMLRRP